ncbi:MAG TPA: universal stress protein [Planctomycetota bacterium]|nr:universal stress protein [Planctomycetota bacterium]
MASEKESTFAPILLMVDSSETVVRAARRAVEVAACLHAKIYAVTVVDTETLTQLLKGKILVQEEMEEFEHDLAESSRRYLRMAAKVAEDAGVELVEVQLKGGWHQTLLAQQRELNAGLLVLGGFTYSMTKRDLVAKAKQHIIDEIPCPVLIVK